MGTLGHAARKNHCFVERKSGTIRSSEGPGNHLRVNPTNFFAELKRRNVYKVAVAYIVAGWANLSVEKGRLKSECGYVESRAPYDRSFKRELEAELDRMRSFLSIGT